MTKEELKDEIQKAFENKPKNWRDGQFVFNYIDAVYGVARIVQFKDGVDCFYRDENIDDFISHSVNHINNG
jgi:hypothetical protein